MDNHGFQLSPVVAVLGGLIGQEIVKGLSGKDEPVQNILTFDGSEGCASTLRCPSK